MSKLETHASDHPKRYCRGDIECKDAIRAALTPEQYEGWLRGTLMKYIWRYDHKGGLDDLLKAQDYMTWLTEVQSENMINESILHL